MEPRRGSVGKDADLWTFSPEQCMDCTATHNGDKATSDFMPYNRI
jgi:hypothetical protein